MSQRVNLLCKVKRERSRSESESEEGEIKSYVIDPKPSDLTMVRMKLE